MFFRDLEYVATRLSKIAQDEQFLLSSFEGVSAFNCQECLKNTVIIEQRFNFGGQLIHL